MPVFGFNSDVKVGDAVFHVQTEDHGSSNPVLATTIYIKGRVLAKRSTNYQEFLASPDFSESELQAMLEQQHRKIIEEVRNGTLAEMAELEKTSPAGSVSVQLLNPATFLKGTTANLDVVVTRRGEGTPLAGASVCVWLHAGASSPHRFETTTNLEGKANLQFPMPRLGPGGAQLVIQATAPDGRDEIKYNVRPRA